MISSRDLNPEAADIIRASQPHETEEASIALAVSLSQTPSHTSYYYEATSKLSTEDVYQPRPYEFHAPAHTPNMSLP